MATLPASAPAQLAAPISPPPCVASEIGRLARVVVHRPGTELRRLTLANRAELLFDDLVSLRCAQEEHDAFCDALRARGVAVLYLEELLAETLALPAARDRVLGAALGSVSGGPGVRASVSEWLLTLSPGELARRLIAGIAPGEPPFPSAAINGDEFVLPPLPNHMYTRDSSTWVSGLVAVGSMALPARQREAAHLETIYRYHPMFSAWNSEVLRCDSREGIALEGGDVLVVGRSCVLVGMGARTTRGAVELFARRLFTAGVAEQVIAVVLPRQRATIHLDTVMTMVDTDAFTIYPALRGALEAYTLRPSPIGIKVKRQGDLFSALACALDVPRLRLIETGGSPATARREQWDAANNLLALAPGVVVAYEHNAVTNRRLREHGIEVVAVPGSNLVRGRGGPRCMSCPIERAAVA